MLNLLLAAMIATTPLTTATPPPMKPPVEMITVQTPTDSFDVYLVIWPDKDHFHIATAGEYQKALPRCRKFNVSMFDQPDTGGVMIAFNCYL